MCIVEEGRLRAFTTREDEPTPLQALNPSVSPAPPIERRNAVLPAIDPNEIVKTGYLVKQGDSVKV